MSLIITKNFKRAKAQDAAADANFKKGDKVTVKTKWAGTRKGIVKEVINDPALKKAYVVEIEGAETAAYPAEIVSADACEDSGELNNDADLRAEDANFKVGDRVKHAKVKSPVQPIGKISEVYNDQRWVEVEWENMPYKYQTIETSNLLPANSRAADAGDAAEFHVGQRVRAKDPRWTGYQGHALGNGIYTVKKVDRDGTVKLDGFLDVWISPRSLVEANDACGKRSR